MKKNIYIFIVVISFVGLISGYNYYKTSNIDINQNINIEETITKRPKIIKYIKEPIEILTFSILIIPSIINVIKTFYKPFTIGYLIAFIKEINFKLSLLYNLIYHIIPYILELILISISIRISINIIKSIFVRKLKINILIKKYILISMLYYIYVLLIYIFSNNITAYIL